MKRLPLLLLSGLVAVAFAACGGKQPETTPTPTGPNADSLRAAQQARDDSMKAAQEEADRRAQAEAKRRQEIADSLACHGRGTEAVKTLLATMIHFDYDKALIRGGDASVLDQKVAILQANSALRIRISGHCDERGPTNTTWRSATGARRPPSSTSSVTASMRAASRPCPTARSGPSLPDTTRSRGHRIAGTSSRFSPAART